MLAYATGLSLHFGRVPSLAYALSPRSPHLWALCPDHARHQKTAVRSV
jgi:hypothetical protein